MNSPLAEFSEPKICTPGYLRRRWIIRIFRICLPGALISVGMVVFNFNCKNICFFIYMYESKSNIIFWVKIPCCKLFADVCWPDSDWFPSQYCLLGLTHRNICACYQTDFPDCYSHYPHWLMLLHAFPSVSVDSLLGLSVSLNCISCSSEFRDKVRKYFLKLKQLRIYIKYVKLGGKISRALCLLLFSLEKSAHSLILHTLLTGSEARNASPTLDQRPCPWMVRTLFCHIPLTFSWHFTYILLRIVQLPQGLLPPFRSLKWIWQHQGVFARWIPHLSHLIVTVKASSFFHFTSNPPLRSQ